MATSSADEAIKARMEAAAQHDDAFGTDDSDAEDLSAQVRWYRVLLIRRFHVTDAYMSSAFSNLNRA